MIGRTVDHRTIAIDADLHALMGELAAREGTTRRILAERALRWYATEQTAVPPWRWEPGRLALPFERPEDIPPRVWEVLLMRMAGGSLGRIAAHYGLTRERIRVLEKKALRAHPEFVRTEDEPCDTEGGHTATTA